MVPFLWPLADRLDTMAYEGAHAIVASTLGFTVPGVTLDRFLVPRSWRRAEKPADRFRRLPGPSGFGLGAAKLIETGHGACVPPIAIILLVLLLFLIRGSFGAVPVPAAIALLAVVIRCAHDGLEEVIAYAMTWLLLSGARNAVTRSAGAGDEADLSRAPRLPRWLWAVLWIAGTLGAAATGGKWLVLRS
jgi:hypothetical protein